MVIKRTFLFIACFLAFAGCKEKEEPETGATMDIMVVFAPGQLGDRGYADSVMDGLSQLDATDKNYDHNILELQFIAGSDADNTQASIKQWLDNPVNPFSGNEYQRRLLVLTEPYMLRWLDGMTSSVRPSDEVLLLKVNDEDVDAATKSTGLGERIHGLNISPAENIRRYCRFIKEYSAQNGTPYDEIPILRLFDESNGFCQYRDSVDIAFLEEFGEEVYAYPMSLAETLGGEEDLLDVQKQSSVMDMAYEMAIMMHELCEEADYRFGVVDLGSANAGFDYFLLGQEEDNRLQLLMLDASRSSISARYRVNRRWDKALLLWGYSWSQSPVGTMPEMVTHNRRDGYSEDNLPL